MCCSLGGVEGQLTNVGCVKGGVDLVNIEIIVKWMDCCIHLTHPDKVIAQVQISEGPTGSSSITDYCEPHKNRGCENLPLMSRLCQ